MIRSVVDADTDKAIMLAAFIASVGEGAPQLLMLLLANRGGVDTLVTGLEELAGFWLAVDATDANRKAEKYRTLGEQIERAWEKMEPDYAAASRAFLSHLN